MSAPSSGQAVEQWTAPSLLQSPVPARCTHALVPSHSSGLAPCTATLYCSKLVMSWACTARKGKGERGRRREERGEGRGRGKRGRGEGTQPNIIIFSHLAISRPFCVQMSSGRGQMKALDEGITKTPSKPTGFTFWRRYRQNSATVPTPGPSQPEKCSWHGGAAAKRACPIRAWAARTPLVCCTEMLRCDNGGAPCNWRPFPGHSQQVLLAAPDLLSHNAPAAHVLLEWCTRLASILPREHSRPCHGQSRSPGWEGQARELGHLLGCLGWHELFDPRAHSGQPAQHAPASCSDPGLARCITRGSTAQGTRGSEWRRAGPGMQGNVREVTFPRGRHHAVFTVSC